MTDLFDSLIPEARAAVNSASCRKREYRLKGESAWPVIPRGNMVLAADTAVELGGPDSTSVSYLLWTENTGAVRDRMFILAGPELKGARGDLPFGKVVILGVSGMDADNCVARHRELDLVRHDVNLRGYMIRSVSQYMREWSRVSREAVADGFSMRVLAESLYAAYKKISYVVSAEILIVTSSAEDVMRLHPAGEKAARLIAAMTKMSDEMRFDCGVCDYSDVCSDVAALREIRNTMNKGAAYGQSK